MKEEGKQRGTKQLLDEWKQMGGSRIDSTVSGVGGAAEKRGGGSEQIKTGVGSGDT